MRVQILLVAFLTFAAFVQSQQCFQVPNPFPIAVMSSSIQDPPCGYLSYNLAILTNGTNPMEGGFTLPLSGIASTPIYTVDNDRQLFYILGESMGEPAIIALSLTLFSGSIAGYLPYDVYVLPRNSSDILAMTYSSFDSCIYFVYVNLTFTKYQDNYAYGISVYNTLEKKFTYLTSTGLIPYPYVPTSPSQSSIALDQVSNILYFMAMAKEGGYIIAWDLLNNELVHSSNVAFDQSLFNCRDWAYDSTSGQIFVICNDNNLLYIGTLSTPTLNKVREVAVIYAEAGPVLPGTFTIDSGSGPGYFAWESFGTINIVQVDILSGAIHFTTQINGTFAPRPIWMGFGEWLVQ